MIRKVSILALNIFFTTGRNMKIAASMRIAIATENIEKVNKNKGK